MKKFYEDIERYEDKVALITAEGEKISYKMLKEQGDDIVAQLDTRKLIFLVCTNSVECICTYIACLNKKIVPVMINDAISKDLFKKLLEIYKPTYLFMPNGWSNELDIKEIKVYRGYKMFSTGLEMDYTLNEELALLLTTSGSTGSPKLVRQSYKNINSNTGAIAEYLDIKQDHRAITTMPMSYTYGLSIINSHLLKGATVIVNEYSLVNKAFWTLLKQEGATTLGGVPYTYEILKKLRFNKMELPSLGYLTQAGGKLSCELSQEFIQICKEKNMKFIIMYGQTEATARMSYLPWEKSNQKPDSIGIAIPGGEFHLIDEKKDKISSIETAGELVYTGDNVTLGYAENCYDLKKGDDNQGVLYTGDMAQRDKDGFYYIIGRKKRFLKLFGNRINLDEVEQLLKVEGYECVCSGNDDKLKIYVTFKENWNNLIGFISKETNIHSSAFEIKYIETIPRNEAGKILYSKLK